MQRNTLRPMMTKLFLILSLWLTFSSSVNGAQLDAPQVILRGIDYNITVTGDDAQTAVLSTAVSSYRAEPDGDGWIFRNVRSDDKDAVVLTVHSGNQTTRESIPVIAAWISVLPPILAIAMALLIRSVLPALMLGLWLGAWALQGMSLKGLFLGLFTSFEVYVANAVVNRDHVTIMLFTFMIAGMVGIVSRNGGMRGIVELIIKGANSAKRG